MLVILSGLPGVGKSTIAAALGARLGAPVIQVDPIESAILRSGIPRSFETGLAAYLVGASVAGDQLRLGLTVIADAANLLEVGRTTWREAATSAGTPWRAIEVACSDAHEHQRRLSSRQRGLDPCPEPTWDEVVRRAAEAEPWRCDHLVLDSIRPVDGNVTLAADHLRAWFVASRS